MKLYVLRDKKADSVAPPFAAPSDGVACRYVMDSFRDSGSTISKYPEDFVLLFVGEYNEADGQLLAGKLRTICEVKALAEAAKG